MAVAGDRLQGIGLGQQLELVRVGLSSFSLQPGLVQGRPELIRSPRGHWLPQHAPAADPGQVPHD